MSTNRSGRGMARKILASIGVVGAAGAIAGLGAFGTFTSTTSASQSVTTGTVTIALGATGASTNRLTVNATGVVPGDTMQRSVDLINTGNQDLASITLTTTATTSTALDTDASNGLQMTIDACSAAWTESGSSPAFTYTCSGSQSTVLSSRAVIGSGLSLSNMTATTAGNTDHLRVTVSLPSSAPNSMQGLTSTVQFSFSGTQRAGTNK